MRAVGVLALAAIAACGPGEDDPPADEALAACFPDLYRSSCIAEVWTEILQTCFDGRGGCSWSETQTGGRRESRFQWENGASLDTWVEQTNLGASFEASSGDRCVLSQIDDTPRCWRFESSRRWYEYCTEVDASGTKPVANHYTCDDGSNITVRLDQLGTVPAMCMSPLAQFEDPFESCVDATGRRYVDRASAGIKPCQGDACGDIGSYCSDAMPCDDGIVCTGLSEDPKVSLGYCTLPCEDGDDACPTGTRCVATLDRPSGTNKRLCHRTCSVSADCEPYGRECIGVTADRPGICG